MKQKPILQTVLLLMLTFLTLPVYANCTAITVKGGSFGRVKAIDADVSHYHLADITVTCQNSSDAYLLGLDGGSHLSTVRQLADENGHTIAYTLFQDDSFTQWGDAGLTNTFPAPALPLSGSGSNTYAVYANATSKDKSPAGLYSDKVIILLKNSGDASTVTNTANFNLYLDEFCSINTGGFTSFGSYPVGHANLTDVPLGSISVTCPVNADYKIGINLGLHQSGTTRQMVLVLNGTTSRIPYQLKCNGAFWGNVGMNTIDINYQETPGDYNACSTQHIGGTETFTISGDATLQDTRAIGTYTDSLIVTIVW